MGHFDSRSIPIVVSCRCSERSSSDYRRNSLTASSKRTRQAKKSSLSQIYPTKVSSVLLTSLKRRFSAPQASPSPRIHLCNFQWQWKPSSSPGGTKEHSITAGCITSRIPQERLSRSRQWHSEIAVRIAAPESVLRAIPPLGRRRYSESSWRSEEHTS